MTRRITALLAAVAVAMPLAPLAPTAAAYDKLCVKNDGAFNVRYFVKFKQRTSVNYSDPNDRSEFDDLIRTRVSGANRGPLYSFPVGTNFCMTPADLGYPKPGETFTVEMDVIAGTSDPVCVHRDDIPWAHRFDDKGDKWHDIFTWTERGGTLQFNVWGHLARARCQVNIQDSLYMWRGCQRGREGFRRGGCYVFRPQFGPSSAFTFVHPSQPVAHLASAVRRGMQTEVSGHGGYPRSPTTICAPPIPICSTAGGKPRWRWQLTWDAKRRRNF